MPVSRGILVGILLAGLGNPGFLGPGFSGAGLAANSGAATPVKPPKTLRIAYKPVPFNRIAGWRDDDLSGAFAAFKLSCAAVPKPLDDKKKVLIQAALAKICGDAKRLDVSNPDRQQRIRRFFETNFRPWRVKSVNGARNTGLLTAYYEPEIEGSLTPSETFPVPVLRRPDDLVDLVDPVQRATVNDRLGAMRKTADGSLVPYFTRGEIEDGALKGRGLELLYLSDPVVAFFMHVQGSARIKFADGSAMRIGFDGKNGYPYTSVARVLIERGELKRAEFNAAAPRSLAAG